jgi:hypothetical protein
MTASRIYRPRASLAAALLLGGLTLAACGGRPSSAPANESVVATPAAASPATVPVGTPTVAAPAAGAGLTTPASAAPGSTSASGSTTSAAQAAAVEQDLAGISNQLAAAGRDLQDGPTEQTIDPRG